jgi:pyruvate,orthophosphate dikinase
MPFVFNFSELDEAERTTDDIRGLLGGKGYGLFVMTKIGLPTPPGFTITTKACNEFRATNSYPAGMMEEVRAQMGRVEASLGKTYGKVSQDPLLVSVRSGAKISMPGMMNTILNCGLNRDIIAAYAANPAVEPRFVWDSYRRLISMFGTTVFGIEDEAFEHPLAEAKRRAGVTEDIKLTADDMRGLAAEFEAVFRAKTGKDFPQDPWEQLELSIRGVFQSWSGKRAVTYRQKEKIPETLGTAVNVVAMIFGNRSDGCSGTGVAFSRDPSTGANELLGEFLENAQGEDVVSGIRNTHPIKELEQIMPQAYTDFVRCITTLEKHFKDLQDVEFTIEKGKLWMLQCRNGKRTSAAAVRVAVELAQEGLISREEAVQRVKPADIDNLLHPQFDPKALKGAVVRCKGVNASPGAAVGRVYFDADTAVAVSKREPHTPIILVRPFTKPDDIHGMLVSKGVLTSEGGATSHASVVARQFGITAVVGAPIKIDQAARRLTFPDGSAAAEADWVSLNGSTGEVFAGQIPTVQASVHENTHLTALLGWCDEIAARPCTRGGAAGVPGLQVWANGDSGSDAARAVSLGAMGLGLCRTEHMFFEKERMPVVQRMILAETDADRQRALDELLPFQRSDFAALFEAMGGRPTIIRLLDPPLHEFLPGEIELTEEVTRLKLEHDPAGNLAQRTKLLAAVHALHEENPMLGLRGVRLSILRPEIVECQVTAIFEGAADCLAKGIKVQPEVMIPLTITVKELEFIQPRLVAVAERVCKARGVSIPYLFGTMVETPRAAITAGSLARTAQFFSVGSNDLTQTTLGLSRDDADKAFLTQYITQGILPVSPFKEVDVEGVGFLIERAVKEARKVSKDFSVGICGEVGGDPTSIEFFHKVGLSYVSVSPFRVPIARLAVAQAALLK